MKDKVLVYRLVGLGIIVVLVWSFLTKGSIKLPVSLGPNIIHEIAQLSSVDNVKSWGTGSKSTNGSNFELNVTAFLPKLSKGFDYYVFLKGDGADLKDMLVGKMVLSGDVYSLNYQGDTGLYGYKSLVVVKETETQAKNGKLARETLSGSFSK